jgi:hypothetical protein
MRTSSLVPEARTFQLQSVHQDNSESQDNTHGKRSERHKLSVDLGA